MTVAYRLTKTSLLHYRQCPKRLYLGVHHPELAEFDPATERRFDQGRVVGALAREIYGPGTLVALDEGAVAAAEQTSALLESSRDPIYEGTFLRDEVLVRGDVLLFSPSGARAIEVKQATSVKETYPADCAIQAWVIQGAGLKLDSFSLAHINSQFVYQGDGNYRGLFTEVPMDEHIRALEPAVRAWIADAKVVIDAAEAPAINVGPHCTNPYDCPFIAHCHQAEVEFPVACLPHAGKKLLADLQADGIKDIRDIPDGRLTKPLHERVRRVTRSGIAELDRAAGDAVRALPYPRYYLDFETIAFAVPIWKATRPYQQLPFQWSLHCEGADGSLTHASFLDTSGDFPLRACAERLLDAIGESGPIIVYTNFEAQRLKDLAVWFSDLAGRIEAVGTRLFDLHGVLRQHYYHGGMRGSWSLKSVLPTIAPELDYSRLGEVADGDAAQSAFLEAIDRNVDARRREELRDALLRYCRHDTLALVRIARFLASSPVALRAEPRQRSCECCMFSRAA